MIIKNFSILKLNVSILNTSTLAAAILLDAMLSILAILSIMPLANVIQGLPPENYSTVTQYAKQTLEALGLSLTVLTSSIIFLIANFIKPFSNYFLQYQILLLKYNFLNKILNNLLYLIFNSEWHGIERVTSGVIVNIFTKEVHSLGDGLNLFITRVVTTIQLISYICVPLYIDFYLSITVFIGFFIVAAPFMSFTALGRKYGRANLSSVNNLMGFVSEMTQNLKMFVATNTGTFALDKFNFYFDAHLIATLRSQLFDKAIAVFFRPFALSVILVVLVYQWSNGSSTTNMITIIWSLISIVPLLNLFIQTRLSLSILEPSFSQVKRLTELLTASAVPSKNVKKLDGNFDIIFDKVSYMADNKAIIDTMNFKFPKSKITCIVGSSGSGKSTIIELITGLKPLSSGRIFYNNIDNQHIDYSHLRDNLGYVGQDAVKLNGSIRENIIWRKEKLTDSDFREMIISSNCEFIWDFPNQLDELVGENRVQLSGGQWQRLSILRAIISKPKILILDEATSALDMASELKVIEGLKGLSWSPTILMISHRKGPINCADIILNLDENKIRN
jgi:ABC-type multidrug transport system fused ATPase/permease subunit